ncbi:MAG: M20/M25/M40 family metallo-hydrolase [Oscillospiraceae bacterium]|nr:M20/M25/M40 family metallo-hydrolase [Oscillospiraceae bacterium]
MAGHNDNFINRERMLRDFTDIISIDSPSLKERKMAAALRAKLESEGFAVYEDGAGEITGGECGNLIAVLPASDGLNSTECGRDACVSEGGGERGDGAGGGCGALPVVALLAHMDTVGPCENKRWTVEGDIIRSDGNTILGGDDAAGIVATLEIARRVKEDNIRHGGILIIYTIAEEIGLDGAKNLDHALIRSALGGDAAKAYKSVGKDNSNATESDGDDGAVANGDSGAVGGGFPQFCFVFDSGGPPGSVVNRAPSHTDIIITVKGAAAHAGIAPEKGINAIATLSDAIAHMPLGRIDEETTANIGIIRGGDARNVVCESATAEGEARSQNKQSLITQVAAMKSCVADACERRGATFEFKEITSYNAFSLTDNDLVIKLLTAAAKNRGSVLKLVPTGGGSDANILNAMGIPAANLPIGMYEVHSTREYTNLRETSETVELVVEAFRLLASQFS